MDYKNYNEARGERQGGSRVKSQGSRVKSQGSRVGFSFSRPYYGRAQNRLHRAPKARAHGSLSMRYINQPSDVWLTDMGVCIAGWQPTYPFPLGFSR